ncbi:hypothetical protein [Rhizobium leguminosarum]
MSDLSKMVDSYQRWAEVFRVAMEKGAAKQVPADEARFSGPWHERRPND